MIRLDKGKGWRSGTETDVLGAGGGGVGGSHGGANARWVGGYVNLAPKSWAGKSHPESSAADGCIIGSKMIRIGSHDKLSSSRGVLSNLYDRLSRNGFVVGLADGLQDENADESGLRKRTKQLDQQQISDALQKTKGKKCSEAIEVDDVHLEKKRGSKTRRRPSLWSIGGTVVQLQEEIRSPQTQPPRSGLASGPANGRRVTIGTRTTMNSPHESARPSLRKLTTGSDLLSASRCRVRRDNFFSASATSAPGASSQSQSHPKFHSDDGTTDTTEMIRIIAGAAAAGTVVEGIFRERAEEAQSSSSASEAAKDEEEDDGFNSMLSLKRANPVYDSEDEDGCYGNVENLSSPFKKRRSTDDDNDNCCCYCYGGFCTSVH